LYKDVWRYDEADKLFQKSLALRAKSVGKTHPGYAENLNDLAELYAQTKRFAEAEALYLEALEIKEKSLGKTHPSYQKSIEDLVHLHKVK